MTPVAPIVRSGAVAPQVHRARPITFRTPVIVDDGHPLRPIRRPPPAAPPAGRVGAGEAWGTPAAADQCPTLEIVDGVLQLVDGPEGASAPLALSPPGAVPTPADPGPQDSARAASDDAEAWIELQATAWLITRESGGLVHASDLVYRLLDRTPEQLELVLNDPGDSSPGFSWIRRTVIAHGRAHVVLRVPATDGTVREIDVVSFRLPPRRGEDDRFYSVLTARDG